MINYGLLSEAIAFYEAKGFQYIEVPWTTTQAAHDITRPVEGALFPLKNEYLIASAEQSFLQLALRDQLPPGKYVSCTPCFRNDKPDALHQPYFMKVELFVYLPENPQDALSDVVKTAWIFFNQFLALHPVKLEDGSIDLESDNGVELGSYGIRHHEGVGTWVYGTGIAEPRLSYTCELEVA